MLKIFLPLLSLLLIGLKLTGYITWSWFVVLLPVLLPFVILFGVLVFWIIILIIAAVLKGKQ